MNGSVLLDGPLEVQSSAPLIINGNFTQASRPITLVLDDDYDGPVLTVNGRAEVDGELRVKSNTGSAESDRVLITTDAINGTFSGVLATGCEGVQPISHLKNFFSPINARPC